MRLTQIVGAQVAWWQLGFRARRAALRQQASSEVMAVAREWSKQVLAAPWWWRLTRVLMIGAVAVLGCAAVMVVALDGKDESVMVNYALLMALPALAASAWWQTRCARRLAVEPGPPPHKAWMAVRATAFVVAVSLLGTMVVKAAIQEHRLRVPCPDVTVDEEVREFTEEVNMCAQGDTAPDVTGLRHTPMGHTDITDHAYQVPGLGVVQMQETMWRAWHANLAALGAPVDFLRGDGRIYFLNFERGHIIGDPPTQYGPIVATAVLDHRYVPKTPVGECHTTDRPCVVSVERTADTITIAWSYPDADAFNVQWWEERAKPRKGIEVAAHRLTLRGSDPARMYGFSVEACVKRFLGRSTCTLWSPAVVVPAAG